MTPAEKRILEALAWMAEQYMATKSGGLDHLCMSAGERAVEVLFDYGMVDCDERGATWTEAGEKLLNQAA